MASNVFSTVRDFRNCVRPRRAHCKLQKLANIFFATGHLEFVAMDLLGSLKKTVWESTFFLVITVPFTRITRCNLLRSTTAARVSAAFLEYWVHAYGAPQYFLVDNGK